jgi:hypothetical protein
MERKNQWHRLQFNDSELISLNYDKLYLERNKFFTETIDGKEDYVVTALYETIGVDGEYSASLSGSSQFSTADVGFYPLCRPYRRDCYHLD